MCVYDRGVEGQVLVFGGGEVFRQVGGGEAEPGSAPPAVCRFIGLGS